jgi:hypothetical protein
MSRLIKWGVVAFAVWWIVKDPTSAGHAASNFGDFLTRAATSLTTAIASI